MVRVETSVTATLQQDGLASLNAYFERGIQGWQGLNGTLSWSQEQASQGSSSAKLVCNGGTSTAITQTLPGNQGGDAPVVPNIQYRFSFKMWSSAPWANNEPVITWRNEDGSSAFGTSVGPTFNHPGGAWVAMEMLATCPVGASRAQLRCRQSNTPPAAQIFYIDEAEIVPSSVPKQIGARATIGPRVYGTRWHITRLASQVNGSTTGVKLRVYRNNESPSSMVDSTYDAMLNTSDTVFDLDALESLIFVWQGGDAGAQCIATISGDQRGRA